jgi:hypothetical protein
LDFGFAFALSLSEASAAGIGSAMPLGGPLNIFNSVWVERMPR